MPKGPSLNRTYASSQPPCAFKRSEGLFRPTGLSSPPSLPPHGFVVPVSDLSVPRRPTRRLAPGCRPPAARPLTSPSPAHPVAFVSPPFLDVLSPRVDCRSRFCFVGADIVIVDIVDGGLLKLRRRIPSMVTVFQFILPAALLCSALAPDQVTIGTQSTQHEVLALVLAPDSVRVTKGGGWRPSGGCQRVHLPACGISSRHRARRHGRRDGRPPTNRCQKESRKNEVDTLVLSWLQATAPVTTLVTVAKAQTSFHLDRRRH